MLSHICGSLRAACGMRQLPEMEHYLYGEITGRGKLVVVPIVDPHDKESKAYTDTYFYRVYTRRSLYLRLHLSICPPLVHARARACWP